MTTTRGLRLNNPFNIRISDQHWLGKVSPGADQEFETFDTPEHGMRAGFKILLTYYHNYKLRTIRDIITRWAPPTENDTQAYIMNVSDGTGMDADEQVNLDDPTLLASLGIQMIKQEQGFYPYTAAQVLAAVNLATAVTH